MPRKKQKKDFDRDQMYSKIMPSITLDNPRFEEEAFGLVEGIGAPEGVPRGQTAVPELRNYMEIILREKLPRTTEVLRACTCERCTLDVLALALNALPPAYAVETGEENPDRVKSLRQNYEVKVTATLIKAIQQVKNAPRH